MAPRTSVRLVALVALLLLLLVVQFVEVQVSVVHRFHQLATAVAARPGGDANSSGPIVEHEQGVPHRVSSNITAAVCHPTLHGRPDLQRVIHWATYYRAIGFDHLFLWHNPDVQELPHFDELAALPFVTLDVANDTVESYYGQHRVERECFTFLARNYTWALAVDADEYL
jgi:hypothetical protein